MKTLKLQLKHLRPEQGLFFDHGDAKAGSHSQVQTGEAMHNSPHLCSGWWNKLTGQLWFDDQPITLYQKVKDGPICVEKLISITEGDHSIIFQKLIVRNHYGKGFKAKLETKFAQLWSDNSEQAK